MSHAAKVNDPSESGPSEQKVDDLVTKSGRSLGKIGGPMSSES